MRFNKIFVIVVLILALVGIQDFVVNGEDVITPFFNNLNGDPQAWHGDYTNLAKKSKSGKIIKPVDDIKRLHIINPQGDGDIEIKGADQNKVTVEYTLSVFAEKETQAISYLDELTLQDKISGGTLTLVLKEPKIRNEYIRDLGINYTIYLPDGISAKIVNNGGSLIAANIKGDLDLNNSNGFMSIRDVIGIVDVETRASELELFKIKGNVNISTFQRDAFISEIEGDLNINSSDGYIDVDNVIGDLTISSNSSRLELRNIEGSIEANQEYSGEFRAKNVVGSINVKGSNNADLELAEIKGDIMAQTQSGDVRVELSGWNEGYEISAETQFGKIRTRLPLEIEEVPNEQGHIARGLLGNGEFKLNLEADRGNIIIRND